MPKLDEAKERLGLLKFWLGIIVGSFLANIAWLATNYNKAQNLIIIGSILSLVILGVAFWIINKKIEQKLKEIGNLKNDNLYSVYCDSFWIWFNCICRNKNRPKRLNLPNHHYKTL